MRFLQLFLLALVGSVFCVDSTTEEPATDAPATKAPATKAPVGGASAATDDPNCKDLDPGCPQVTQEDCNDPMFGDQVSQKCPKTCGTCYRTTVPATTEAPCVDQTIIDCAANADKCGQAALMTKYCMKTCGLCGTTAGPSQSSCQDKPGTDCASKKALCSNPQYKDLMTEFCPVTCNFCGQPSGCQDMDSRCTQWAGQGFCTNPFYTPADRQVCQKTCGLC